MKQIIFAIGFLVLLSSFFFVSCRKNEVVSPDNTDSVDSTYYIRFSIDGDSYGFADASVKAATFGTFIPLDSIVEQNHPVFISAKDKSDHFQLNMYGKPMVSVYDYYFSPDSVLVRSPIFGYLHGVATIFSTYIGPTVLGGTFPTTQGNVTLTKITETTVEGTFEGTVQKKGDPNVYELSNGRFVARKWHP